MTATEKLPSPSEVRRMPYEHKPVSVDGVCPYCKTKMKAIVAPESKRAPELYCGACHVSFRPSARAGQ